MKITAEYWRQALQLTQHVEGGSFCETYRAPLIIAQDALPDTFAGARPASTAIYFLLEDGDFSAFHRIAADEMWHFYDGQTLHIYEIKPDGSLHVHRLGRDVAQGEQLQVVIPAGSWFASSVEETGGFALTGCTVAPGFDFADFELAGREELSQQYPQHAGLIALLTRS
ncbi:cupin domain-containing protein [Chitinophaga lutea]|uniref:Cupin domain-containing protein n=1 Tax=Chitinophaga lutea TaxID=2488634 RepID=A0A3N4PPL7_9BACT|nr:cupin domain-containing protein [Chitinophaga lutea]RPE09685.1 cupin domain-containing protein [Chitinophaga lutea]